MSTTKERSILLTGEDVRWILAGRKTVLRRLVKDQPRHEAYSVPRDHGTWWGIDDPTIQSATYSIGRCPFGAPGDRLWGRETWGTLKGNGVRIVYRADGPPICSGTGEKIAGMKWGSASSMPRRFIGLPVARIFLDVASVRVERLHDITEEDAIREGVPAFFDRFQGIGRDQTITTGERAADAEHRASFAVQWDDLHGDAGHLWISNPWVWRAEIKRCST